MSSTGKILLQKETEPVTVICKSLDQGLFIIRVKRICLSYMFRGCTPHPPPLFSTKTCMQSIIGKNNGTKIKVCLWKNKQTSIAYKNDFSPAVLRWLQFWFLNHGCQWHEYNLHFYRTPTSSFSSDLYTHPDCGAVSWICFQYPFAGSPCEGKKISE